MKPSATAAIAWTLLAILPHATVGQVADPLVTDRPDFTESTVAVMRGALQFEGGYTLGWGTGETSHSLGEVLLRVGIGGPLEFRAGLNSYQIADAGSITRRGFEDASVGAKLELRGAAGIAPAAGIIATLSLPTGSDPFSANTAEPELIAAFGWELPAGWSLGSNVGYLWGDTGVSDDNRWSGSLVLGRPVSGRLGIFAELYGFHGASADNELFADGGVTMGISEDLQVDFRLAARIDGNGSERHVGIGFARRWHIFP